MMEEKVTMDTISETGCSIKKQKYIEEAGKVYNVGMPERIAYVNSNEGREQMQKDYPEYFEVLKNTVWGNEAKVEPMKY